MMKKVTLGLALAAASACAFADWVPTLQGGNYTGTMGYSLSPTGPLTYVNSVEAITSAGDNPALPITNFGEQALTIQPALRGVIDGMVQAAAAGQKATVGSSALSGAINVAVTPLLTSPRSQAVFSGPVYTTSITATRSYPGVTVRCTSNIKLSNIKVTVVYNPHTGEIDDAMTPAQPLSFDSTSSTGCTSSLDDIDPVVLGAIADKFGQLKADPTVLRSVRSFQTDSLRKVFPSGPLFTNGFKTAVQSSVYMFAGADMGAYIVNNMDTLMSGMINMTIGQPQVEGPFVYGISLTAPLSYSNTEFSITFVGYTYQLNFAVTSHRYFDYTYQCPAGSTRGCNEP